MNITEENDYSIRYSNQEDYPFLHKWLGECRKWYPVSSDKDVEAMAKNWIGFYRYGASLTAVYKNQLVGIATLFLMPYRKVIHHCLVYFIVDPNHTRKGVGISLIKNINHLGKNYFRFEWMNIEIFEECPAIPLIEKAGYEEVFKQEKFVKEKAGYLARHLYQINFSKDQDDK
ncbi:MAG: GNAT family N-acetyltransferase [Candidatus Neptunochlamydia sp.]|nr:GNAT family N-acetyltransferase [Candidatus Neptunochlamydia sp.]